MITRLFLLSLATAAISMTLSKAKIFKPMRKAIKARWHGLGELISCPYCTSHWVALTIIVATGTNFFGSGFWRDWFLSSMVLVAGATPFAWMIYLGYSSMTPPEREEDATT